MRKHIDLNEAEQWDMVLEPKVHLFDLNLKEFWRYRDLLVLFIKRDFAAQYKQTVLGPLWHFIQPIFTSLMFLFVFGKMVDVPTDGIEPKLLFFMSGVTIWNYFSACISATSSTFVANAGIFGKVYFPRLIIPVSNVISNMIRFVFQFSLLLMLIIWFGLKSGHFYISLTWLFVPLLLLMMAGIGLGMGIIISSLTTKYRDFTVLISFGVQLLMYVTPVAYPLSYLKTKSFAGWIAWNPLSPIVEAFRYSIFGAGSINTFGLLYSFGFMCVTVFLGLLIFSKVERSFMDTV